MKASKTNDAKKGMRVFGAFLSGISYRKRVAAYVVVSRGDMVAAVRGRRGYFLPGGGSLAGETPRQTVVREVREELACGVRLEGELGTARQYFTAGEEGHFDMRATFFAGALVTYDGASAAGEGGEHELVWLPIAEADAAFYHACHAWAVRRASSEINRNENENTL